MIEDSLFVYWLLFIATYVAVITKEECAKMCAKVAEYLIGLFLRNSRETSKTKTQRETLFINTNKKRINKEEKQLNKVRRINSCITIPNELIIIQRIVYKAPKYDLFSYQHHLKRVQIKPAKQAPS